MNLNISIQGMGGHTEVDFKPGQVKLTWKETSLKERAMLRAMIKRAKEGGMKTYDAGDATSEGAETSRVPGTIFNRSGSLVLKGDGKIVNVLAQGIVDAELAEGKLVMEATKGGEWKILKAGQFDAEKPEEEKKERKVVTTSKKSGG